MGEYRRHDRKTKLSVVMAAELVGVTAAAEQAGIPATTVSYWYHDPKFAEFRTKTREDLNTEIALVAHLAWARVAETMSDMEPRDAMFAAEKATSLMLLAAGEATTRSETKDLTHELDDHESEVLGEVVRTELARRADEHVAEPVVEGAEA